MSNVSTECALRKFYVSQINPQVRALALNTALSENIFGLKDSTETLLRKATHKISRLESPGKRELREVDGVPSFLFFQDEVGYPSQDCKKDGLSTRWVKVHS